MAQEPTPTGAGLVYGGAPGTGAATVIGEPKLKQDLTELHKILAAEEQAKKAARASVGKHMSEIDADGWWRHDEESKKRMNAIQGQMADDYMAHGKGAYTDDNNESSMRRQTLYKQKSDVEQFFNKSNQMKDEWVKQNDYLTKNLDNVTPESRERHYEWAKKGYNEQIKEGFPRLDMIDDPSDYMDNLNSQKLPGYSEFNVNKKDAAGRSYSYIQKSAPLKQLRVIADNWVDAGKDGSNPFAEQLVADQLALIDRDPTTKILPKAKRDEMAIENAKAFVLGEFESQYPSQQGPEKFAAGAGKRISKEPPTAGFYQERSGEGVSVLKEEGGEQFDVETGEAMVFNPGSVSVKIKPTNKRTAKGEPIPDTEATDFQFMRIEMVPTAKIDMTDKGKYPFLQKWQENKITEGEWIPEDDKNSLKEGVDYEMMPYAVGQETYYEEDFTKPAGMEEDVFAVKIEEGDTEDLPTKQVKKVRTVYFPEQQNTAALENRYKDYRKWKGEGSVFGDAPAEGEEKESKGTKKKINWTQ